MFDNSSDAIDVMMISSGGISSSGSCERYSHTHTINRPLEDPVKDEASVLATSASSKAQVNVLICASPSDGVRMTL